MAHAPTDISAACAHDNAHRHHTGHDHSEGKPPAPFDPEALVSARGLALTRGGRGLLEGVDIDVHDREIVTLIGPNGAGKTTLVRVLLGLERADAGEVRRGPGLVVGYVPQRFDIDRAIPMTVERFLRLGRPAGRRSIAATLDEVGAVRVIASQLSQLSGGELQRVLLARALLVNPSLLVLDEPVRGVDYTGEAELYALISRLRKERGLGVLLVSHDLHIVMASSDRVLCLNRHVCCSGVPERVAQHPEYVRLFGHEAARALGVYHHHHDHAHDITGKPLPPPPGTPSHDGAPAIRKRN